MKRKGRWFRVGFVAGYVLGTKAGRERYEDMRRAWLKLRTSEAFRTAEAKVREQLRSARQRPATTSNGSYTAAPFETEFTTLRTPGI
jgi:hypothetical protein